MTQVAKYQQQGNDGWTPVNATWTYASASTITVPSGAASIYQKGDRIKWTQTTVKYGVIVAVADTLLTIAVNTDYTVANAAITLPHYSHQANPLGYPTWFNWTSSLTWTGGTAPSGSPTVFSKYKVDGASCTFNLSEYGFTVGTNNTRLDATLPINFSGVQGYAGSFRGSADQIIVTNGYLYPNGIVANCAASTIGAFTFFGTYTI